MEFFINANAELQFAFLCAYIICAADAVNSARLIMTMYACMAAFGPYNAALWPKKIDDSDVSSDYVNHPL